MGMTRCTDLICMQWLAPSMRTLVRMFAQSIAFDIYSAATAGFQSEPQSLCHWVALLHRLCWFTCFVSFTPFTPDIKSSHLWFSCESVSIRGRLLGLEFSIFTVTLLAAFVFRRKTAFQNQRNMQVGMSWTWRKCLHSQRHDQAEAARHLGQKSFEVAKLKTTAFEARTGLQRARARGDREVFRMAHCSDKRGLVVKCQNEERLAILGCSFSCTTCL